MVSRFNGVNLNFYFFPWNQQEPIQQTNFLVDLFEAYILLQSAYFVEEIWRGNSL